MTRKIRTLTPGEIATLLDWAADEGWNPGLNDTMAFHAADPRGFFGAFVDGTMVAGISAVAYDAHFGFIGLYICHPHWRGQGHGKAVWDAGLAYLGDRTIGLDGVPEQQANYARMGFVPAYETVRMSGLLPAPAGSDQASPVASLQDLRDLDRQCFPALRDGFLRHWLAPPNRLVAHWLDGKLAGYGVQRPCRQGYKIGPLFADHVSVATHILSALTGDVHIDVPTTQPQWLDALSALGFSPGLRTRRMYRGTAPAVQLPKIMAVSSLELG